MNQLIEEAYRIFEKDRFAMNMAGVVIESIEDDVVVCSMEITDNHLNAVGSVMGGAIFTLADFTFAIAANFRKTDITVTLDSHICYLGVAKGNKLFAKSRCIKQGYTSAFYDITITDNLGTSVAQVTITGYTKHSN